MGKEKKNRRLLVSLASIPIIAALAIAILQGVLSLEPPAEIYSGVYPIAGPLLQLVDAYSFQNTLRDASSMQWVRYVAWCVILVFLMFSPAIFYGKTKLFPYCVAAALAAFAGWWLWGFVVIGIGV